MHAALLNKALQKRKLKGDGIDLTIMFDGNKDPKKLSDQAPELENLEHESSDHEMDEKEGIDLAQKGIDKMADAQADEDMEGINDEDLDSMLSEGAEEIPNAKPRNLMERMKLDILKRKNKKV